MATKPTKKELLEQFEKISYVEKQKQVAKGVFPFVETLATIYDAQTAFLALAGYMESRLMEEQKKLTVADIAVSFDKEKDSEIKTAMRLMLGVLEKENAMDAVSIIRMMGNKLPEYVSLKHMKDPMTITASEFIA